MKTTDLIEQIATSTGMARQGVKSVVDALVDAMATTAKQGEDVVLTGFGQFKVKAVAARQGRNPQSGETMEIAATRKLAFSPAKPLKDALKG